MNMGMAREEAREHDEQWRKMAIEEWGHTPTCAVFNVMGTCDCGQPNKPPDKSGVMRNELITALTDAIWAADYLAQQQAMPDDGYKERLEKAREVLKVAK